MRVPRSILAVAVSLILCAAGAGTRAQEGSSSRDPNWFNEMLAREAAPLAERLLASDDGAFETRVAAEISSQPKPSGRGYYVQLDVGTDVPMECWIYPKGSDVAASHRAFSERVFKSIEKQGAIDLKEIQRIDAGVFGGHPYLALDWLYRVKTRRGTLAGQVKLLAAFKSDASVHCLQNEAGYAKTFERVFRGLVDRLEVEAAAGEPYYREVTAVTMGGRKIGAGQLAFTRDSQGGTRIAERTFLLVPTGQATLMATDSYEVQWSTPGGRLTREISGSGVNGQLERRLVLDQAGDGGWTVSGKFKSKDLKTTLEPKVLPSALGEMLLLRQFVAGAGAGDRKDYWDWSASADPSAYTVVKVQVRERTAAGVATRVDMGSEVLDVIFDDSGSARLATMDLGGVGLELRRIHVQGSLDGRTEPRAPAVAQAPAAAQGPAPAADTEPEILEKGESQDPNWFDKLLAREAEALEERPLASEDGVFKTRVAAEIEAQPQLVDTDYYVQLNLGTVAPVECWVYPEGHDMAASHRAFSAVLFESIADTQGTVEMKAIQRIDAGAFGAHPYLALDWLYRVQSPRGPLAGQLKLLAAYKGGASVHCFHNEAGYGKSFERVVRGLVERLEVQSAAAEPYYELILQASLRELKLGVARTKFTRQENGNTRISEELSALLPISRHALASHDTYNIQIASPDGRLLTEVDIESKNGEVTTHLTLESTGDNTWKVSGTYDSKDFTASPEPREILSSLGEKLLLREFLAEAGAGDEKVFWDWSSDADPAAFNETRVRVEGRTADGVAVHLDLGPNQLEAILDADAAIKSATLKMEEIEMGLERVYAGGSLVR